jgi:DsbC/DsbD-like thiol-disulfide interchange protein
MNHSASHFVPFMRLAGAAVILAALAVLIGGTPVSAGGKKESKVKLSASATKSDAEGRQVVTISMEIDKGWHTYANPVQNEDLVNAQTTVKITGANKLQDVKISYPEGKRKIDGKESYFQYEGKIEIQATIKRAAGDTGPLDVSVKFMSCNDSMCLPPEEVTLKVK